MGTSIAMIDLHYGHLAVDSYERAVSLLDALALERAVDAACNSVGFSASGTLTSKDPEPPRKASNLSPKPSPNETVLVGAICRN